MTNTPDDYAWLDKLIHDIQSIKQDKSKPIGQQYSMAMSNTEAKARIIAKIEEMKR